MSTPQRSLRRRSLRAPKVLVWVALLLGVAGLIISGYLTYEHFTGSTTLACPETGRINCTKVTSSPYSEIVGVPVALLGTLYFLGSLPLLLPAAWAADARWVPVARLGLAGLGVVMVLYLLWAEFYGVGAICLWCTAVHAVTFLLFVTVVFGEALRMDD